MKLYLDYFAINTYADKTYNKSLHPSDNRDKKIKILFPSGYESIYKIDYDINENNVILNIVIDSLGWVDITSILHALPKGIKFRVEGKTK